MKSHQPSAISYQRKQGFALLLALLVGSTVLAVALGVMNNMNRQLEISSLGRESQEAFYAADSGIECALYWEVKQAAPDVVAFATSSVSVLRSDVVCNGVDIDAGWSLAYPDGISATTVFEIVWGNGSCSRITVAKTTLPTAQAVITSDGFNNSCSGSKVNRTLKATIAY